MALTIQCWSLLGESVETRLVSIRRARHSHRLGCLMKIVSPRTVSVGSLESLSKMIS